MTSQVLPQISLLASPNDASLSSLTTIGSHLYSMMSSIYKQQFKNSSSTGSSETPQIKTSDLLLEDEIDLTDLTFSSDLPLPLTFKTPNRSTPLPKNNSFSTFYTNESLLPQINAVDKYKRHDSFSMFSTDDIFSPENKFSSFNMVKEQEEESEDFMDFVVKKKIKKDKNEYPCRFCPHISETKQKLGGHVSRQHKGRGMLSQRKQNALRNEDYERVLKNTVLVEKLFSMS